MKVKYTAPVVIKLRVSEAILAHQRNLIKQFENKEISFEEMKRKEFPVDAIKVIEEALKNAVDKNSCDANLDAEALLKAYPPRKKLEAANAN
jgi:hypothetical protein